MTEIDDIDEYIQKNLPKKYLNAFSKEELDELINRAFDNCYELRSAGGLADPPGYTGDEPYEGPIPGHQLYDQLLCILEEMEQSAIIIKRAIRSHWIIRKQNIK